jgi:adenylate cyclase
MQATESQKGNDFHVATGRKRNLAIVAILIMALAYFAYDKFVPDPNPAGGDTPQSQLLDSKSPEETPASSLYLKGKQLDGQNGQESLREAEQAFRKALVIDPKHAAAWVGLSFNLRSQANQNFIDLHQGTEAAREAALSALELDQTQAEAWAALAEIQFVYGWQWEIAEETIQTALQHGPENGVVVSIASMIMRGLGRLDRAIDYALMVVEADPLDRRSLRNLAVAYWLANRMPDAEATLRRLLELYPETEPEKAFLAAVLNQLNRYEEALAYIDLSSDNFWHRTAAVTVLRNLGRLTESDQLLQALIEEMNPRGAYQFAQEYAMRGDTDEAFKWLNTGYYERDGGFIQVITDPLLVSLHDDPRWEEILGKVGILEYWFEY